MGDGRASWYGRGFVVHSLVFRGEISTGLGSFRQPIAKLGHFNEEPSKAGTIGLFG